MDVRLPDGTIIRNVPDGTTRDDLTAKLKANGYNLDEPKPQASPEQGSGSGGMLGDVARLARMATPMGVASALLTPEGRQQVGNAVAGGVKGFSQIGSTLLAPLDVAQDAIEGRGLTLQSNGDRRAAVTQVLESAGADPKSGAYQVAQGAAEVAGTLPVGGVLAKPLQAALPRLATAIGSGGLSTGARVAPGLANKAEDLGIRTAGAVINGGASAGLVNPEDSATGAALNGAIPVVTKVLGSAGRLVGNAVSSKAARGNATEKIAETLGEDAIPQALGDIQTHYPKGAENIPLSAAAIVKNPKLAQLEQGSRLKAAPAWWEFDQKQGKAVFDNVMDATSEAGELGARKAARSENWQAAWDKAAESQKPRIWNRRMGQLGGDLDQALASPQASNPDVRRVLEAVRDEVVRVGPSFSPAHLQQLRANLNGKANSLSPDVFKSAPRDNPAIIDLMKEMDDILNVSTGGKWQKVLEGYAKDSDKVRASAAASKVRDAYVDGATGRVRGTALDPDGDVSKITEAGLSRALDAARLPDKSLALSEGSLNRLHATLEALRSQNVVQGLKRSASAGGGSDTIPNAIAAGAAQTAGAPSFLLQALGAVKKLGTGKTDAEMARLLANPDELAKALEGWMRPAAPSRAASIAYRAVPAIAADR
jgi:hypothetical protein